MVILLPVEDPSASPGSCTSYQLTRTGADGQFYIVADPSGVPYVAGELATGLPDDTFVEVRCGDTLQPLGLSSPQPT